ncbi:preprotein translocase subunit SecA [Pigmentibacter sp. JX0631]|uniref:preprotein translocase subunit SecA n=1 Tax=Pigmentibacter sp. JX0631 TaxID=2976982 RepID=UPI0024688494|nr:preprotein translocase subunit SecA [Pigmentibacter sp. JX0631]WGL60314.1 preprotein translocase subunit SecA [Pigmentibacter sp. JX0631]
MLNILKSLFGTKNDRELRKIAPILTKINTLEATLQAFTDAQLKAKTAEFKERYQKGETLDSLLPEAFAVVREASKRSLGKRHFDVQLIGGSVLHQGKIAEMRTGEGKTLTATAPVYLNALTGKGVHVVTVNEYLASTQSEEMGRLYSFLGLTTGCILNGMSDQERQEAYRCDVTYATNNELGFDYLRDNMKVSLEDFVQRGHHFAIVDEVDSILIDEARTPLIISGPSDTTSDKYITANNAIRGLRKEIDYTVDEKSRACALTEAGISKVEKRLNVENLFDPENNELVHACNNALRAHVLFRKDDHYIVQNGQIIIVDEFTGRLMHGRRFSDGLHQALEGKENVQIQPENQTLAQVTLQNYFRMYEKLSGMTGTADTEAVEFHSIYKLSVVVIPTNRPMVRKDHDDVLYLKQATKFNAVADEIEAIHKKGQPVLVGTVSIEKSELLSELLKKKNIPHQVLNAKHHEQEAKIIAEAGQKGKVTLSTNMAGRGTDIILGSGVPELGGLFVIGTERHESRRIDNQLRGRSGRQGDPGASKFFLSWEDELMRRFNNKANQFIMERFVGDEAIHDPRLTNVIGKVQKRVEGFNYDIRKQLLQYDDVLNQQRKAIYSARMRILRKENVKDILAGEPIQKFARTICDDFSPPSGLPGEMVAIDYRNLERILFRNFNKAIPFTPEERVKPELTREEFYELITKKLEQEYNDKEKLFGVDQMRDIERWVMLQTIDSWWKDHLLNIDHLKDGIGLRGYAQKDPLQEYKNEAFELFIRLIAAVKQDSLQMIYRIQPNLAEKFIAEAKAEAERKAEAELKNAHAEHEDPEEAFENKLEEQEALERKRAMYSNP